MVLLIQGIFGQGVLNLKEKRIKKDFNYYAKKYPNHTQIIETDTSLYFSLKDSTVRPMTQFYHFDRNHLCDSYAISFDCDSCLRKFLKLELHASLVKYRQLSPTLYISKYYRHRIIELILNKNYTYVVKRTYFTKTEYDEMIRNKAYW